MMVHAKCYLLQLFSEAYKTAALMDGLSIITIDRHAATHYVHWDGENPNFVEHLQVWGEADTVKMKTGKMPKLADCGVQCIFVGYAIGHSGATCHLWDPYTCCAHVSHDVIW
jgi:hypothetical protein